MELKKSKNWATLHTIDFKTLMHLIWYFLMRKVVLTMCHCPSLNWQRPRLGEIAAWRQCTEGRCIWYQRKFCNIPWVDPKCYSCSTARLFGTESTHKLWKKLIILVLSWRCFWQVCRDLRESFLIQSQLPMPSQQIVFSHHYLFTVKEKCYAKRELLLSKKFTR